MTTFISVIVRCHNNNAVLQATNTYSQDWYNPTLYRQNDEPHRERQNRDHRKQWLKWKLWSDLWSELALGLSIGLGLEFFKIIPI